MDFYSEWGGNIGAALEQLLQKLILYLPNLLGAILLLILGWILARVLRGFSVRLITLMERLFARLLRRGVSGESAVSHTTARIFGGIVFWLIILFFVTAATQVLGLAAFTDWLNRLVVYLPTLFAGVLIILAGVLFGNLSKDIVVASLPLPREQKALVGRATQLLILATAVVIGADQIGINVTLLVTLAAVIAGTFLGGVALAVSLGARQYVSNLIGAHHLRQSYRVGERIKLGDYEGRIVDFTPIAVLLETEEGRVNLPARCFIDEPSVLYMGTQADE